MIGKILANRYEIIEKIGVGGMAVVYKAKCRVLNRYVAIKILREEFLNDPEVIDKFKQESLSAASLGHPNIVNVYDTGIEDNIYYIVIEYVKGETLKKYINRKGKLEEKEAIEISKQIAEALKHAHANKIIHKDIKPHNILLTEDGVVKVTDFGIAKASTSSTINNTSNVIGSVHYFSPEQARGGYVDQKSDIYSLGVVMYEMVTGTLPFDADNHITVAMKQIQENPEPPSLKVKGLKISNNFEEIIMKCLEKHQSYRFNNIDELIKKLNLIDSKTDEIKDEKSDSPTIFIPKINTNVKEENYSDDDTFNKALKSFFDEKDDEKDDIYINKAKSKDESKKRNSTKSKINNFQISIAAIISALLLSILFGIMIFNSVIIGKEITVPNLVGQNEEQAKKITEKLGLTLKVTNRVFNLEYDEGVIIDQSVEKGIKVKEDYPIEVTISKGSKEITVPDLIGRYGIEAGIILKEYGLKEGTVTEQYSDKDPVGKIITQKPAAKTPAKINDKVDYVVSIGPKLSYSIMPNLLNLSVDEAKLLIEKNKLVVGEITQEFSNDVEKGLIIRQSVKSDQEVLQGTAIWMTVSKGKEVTINPDGTINNPNIDQNNEQATQPGKYPLTVVLPKNKEKVTVVVQKISPEGIQIVYSKEVNTSEDSLIINLTDKGTKSYEIYIDNQLYDRVDISFE